MSLKPPAAQFDVSELERVHALVSPLYWDRRLNSGEPMIEHAQGVVQIVRELRPDPDLLAAAMLFGVHEVLRDADAWLNNHFGVKVAQLVAELRQLMRVSERTRGTVNVAQQSEALRKMVLAMTGDMRVVLLRLASRLQTLRWFAHIKQGEPEAFARETLQLYAPLANRLGVWQLKWALEDLSFRFLEPNTYKAIATQLDAKRGARESFIAQAIDDLKNLLSSSDIAAEVSGRPKHIYSIWSKMQSKRLGFDQVYDVRALRVIVQDVAHCYQVLSLVHERYTPVPGEFDDYIARPKPNGYQSLHTVVKDAESHAIEIQIRTQQMHEDAELGLAAHWRYKEEGSGRGADKPGSASVESERVAWLRQLLAWRDDVAPSEPVGELARIYVLTPQARVVELPAGATPIDFAYHLHTDLGHRCRGARVDGAMVPLNTRLVSGQTVEIMAAKTGGPSRDWLNIELGYLASARSRAKVRQWFNAQAWHQTVAVGREALTRELARLGRSTVKLDDLAQRLGFDGVDALCVAVAKDELSLRHIEQALSTAPVAPPPPPVLPSAHTAPAAFASKGQVLVVGVDALLTNLARCCRPVPPDDIVGFVTRGKGVSIHRTDCSNVRALSRRLPERLIEVTWGKQSETPYPVDIIVLAADRPGLLRDVIEAFAREKINVVRFGAEGLPGMGQQPRRGEQHMRFTIHVRDVQNLNRALALVQEVSGVWGARRA